MAGKRDLFINGQWSAAKNKATFPVYNPSTGEVWSKVADASRADAAAAIEAAAWTLAASIGLRRLDSMNAATAAFIAASFATESGAVAGLAEASRASRDGSRDGGASPLSEDRIA